MAAYGSREKYIERFERRVMHRCTSSNARRRRRRRSSSRTASGSFKYLQETRDADATRPHALYGYLNTQQRQRAPEREREREREVSDSGVIRNDLPRFLTHRRSSSSSSSVAPSVHLVHCWCSK